MLSFIARQDLPPISSVSSKHFSIITGRNSKIPCFSCATQSNEHQFGPETRHRSLGQSLHVGNESLHALIDYLSGWSFQQRTPFHCEHCKVYNCHTQVYLHWSCNPGWHKHIRIWLLYKMKYIAYIRSEYVEVEGTCRDEIM